MSSAVDARRLRVQELGPGETLAKHGRTVYPRGADPGRQAFVDARERRPFAERLADTRLAARLPEGRASHLVQRFPPLPAVGGPDLYVAQEASLAGLYEAVMGRLPELVPTVDDLAEAAALGEESVVDLLLAGVDRDVRLFLDESPDQLRVSDGERQILDALLVVAEDGHAPGTRVRMLAGPAAGRTGTVVGALWGATGAPVGYRVRSDATGREFGSATADLVVLVGQECLGR